MLFKASLKKTLVIAFSLIALIPMVTVAIVFYGSAQSSIERQAFDQLTAVNAIKKQAVQDYFQQIADQVVTQSDNLMIKSAFNDFSMGFYMASIQLAMSGADSRELRAGVERYYESGFASEYLLQNDKAYEDPLQLANGLDNDGVAMQHEYIVANPHELGSKNLLSSRDNGTDYDEAHAKYHPWFAEFQQKFGYNDIYLIDADGNVVYSVFKGLDFGTSLNKGAYSNSHLASAFHSAMRLTESEAFSFADFQQYLPSFDAPASFIAAPIVENGRAVGVLAFQLPIDRINKLMGQREGMGDTGESYLIGPDNLMRSDSLHDPEHRTVVNSIRNPELGAVDTLAVRQSLAGETGTQLLENYQGSFVLSSYAPVGILGAQWAIVSELDAGEALAATEQLRTTAVVLIGIVGAVVAGVAYVIATSIANPVSNMTRAVKQIAAGSLDVTLANSRKDEIGELGQAMQEMQSKLKTLIDEGIRPIAVQASKGELRERLRLDGASGFYAEMVDSMNALLEVNESFLQETAEVIEGMSAGDLTRTFQRRFSGSFYQVQEDIDSMRATLHEIIDIDTQSLVSAARKGDLGRRIDLSNKRGCFRDLGENINALVEINDNIISDVIDVTSALAEGRLDTRISRRYEGRFAQLVNNVATMQQQLVDVIDRDIHRIVASAADGDLSNRIQLDDKQGFYKELSISINELVGTCDQIISESSEVMSAVSQGDLSKQIRNAYRGTFDSLKNAINHTVLKLTGIVEEIQGSASAVKIGAAEISRGSGELSSRTEEQAASLEETSTSMRELTSLVRGTAENSEMARGLSTESSQVAMRGGQVLNDAVEAMEAILRSSESIANFVNVIDEIAFQTNLLALNASVEAARAGEQGRGFAVVAEEVRVLASRSAESAREIKLQIEDSRLKVSEGSELVNESGRVLSEIIKSVDKVNQIISEISVTCDQQSKGLDEISNAVEQMDNTTQQNAALVEENAAASESLSDQARQLDAMIAYFHIARRGESRTSRVRPNLRVAN
jgi:methyl-accepting chemotaxis protein